MDIAALALVIAKQAARLAQKPLLKAAGLDAVSQALKKANAQFLSIFTKELEFAKFSAALTLKLLKTSASKTALNTIWPNRSTAKAS